MTQEFTLSEIFATPYFSQLNSVGNTKDLVFAVNDQGHRNVYIARYPDYKPENLTKWNEDTGLEITSLSVSRDGQWATFVHGGEHGAWEIPLANPASFVKPQQILIYTIHLPTGNVTLIGEGDYPEIHPDCNRVSYRLDNQVWISPMDGNKEPVQLFSVKGNVVSMQWSPNGKQLLFENNRGGYSFIGVFEEGKDRIRWIAPSYRRDRFPRWSPDGKQVVFMRNLASSSVSIPRQSWSIMVTDLATDDTREVWTLPNTSRGLATNMPGTFNLRWLMDDAITFTSFQDGWPHLYKVNPHTSEVGQLTQGDFTFEQLSYSNDGSKVLLSVNTGDRDDDKDRKHIAMVDVSTGEFNLLTKGIGIETDPVFVSQTSDIAFFSSTPHRPTLPTIMNVNNLGSQKVLASSLLPDFDYNRLVVPEHVFFNSEDGHPVYGQIFKPKVITEKTPAIVYIHGGPNRQTLLGWHFADYYFHDYMLNQYLTNMGYVVLSVNYRLGTGYGYDFQYAKNTGGRNGIAEYQDIHAAGKWLAEQPFVDSNRIGVYGGSYGGFLTAMALSKNSDIFKVGVNIHGANYRMLKGKGANSSIGDSITIDWKSPVLIIHGDDDYNVKFQESIELSNRLMSKDVDVEYLIFPDENHHWMLFENLMKMNEATAQFLMEKMPVE
jgi:dipeptidyl aminopeptidase/acylaminoacyl peptidase